MVEIFIENIIASATVSGSLDLEQIIDTLPNCEYKPDQFPGVVFRPADPHVVILLFNNGKMMVTAAKSVEDVQKGMEMVEAELDKAGLLTPIDEIKDEGKEKAEDEGEGEEPSDDKKPEEAGDDDQPSVEEKDEAQNESGDDTDEPNDEEEND